MHRAIVFIVFISLLLSGCRYWSLYKFADQFCDFDEHVSVSQKSDNTHIDFLDPVLPRTLLLRYLHAQPLSTTYKLEGDDNLAVALSDTFYIQRTYLESQKPVFNFKLAYHLVDDTPLLSSGTLDARLSALFSPKMVEPILKSICSDDYDLSLSRLDMRFTLSGIDTKDLPDQKEFISVFGEPDANEAGAYKSTVYKYRFDFVQNKEIKNNVFQNRPIDFSFGFNHSGELLNLHILYYKYDYWLDFENQKGTLIVIRG